MYLCTKIRWYQKEIHEKSQWNLIHILWPYNLMLQGMNIREISQELEYIQRDTKI